DSVGHSAVSATATVAIGTAAASGYDTPSSATGAGTTTLSWSHTVGTAGARVLVVGVDAESTSNTCQPSGVTYGGAALTKIAQNVAGTATYDCSGLWYLLNPPSGSATVTVTWAAAPTN